MSDAPAWAVELHRDVREITAQRQAPSKKPVDWPKLVLFLLAVGGAAFGAASYLFVTEAQQTQNELTHANIVGKLQLFADTLESVQAQQMKQDKIIDELHPRNH